MWLIDHLFNLKNDLILKKIEIAMKWEYKELNFFFPAPSLIM